MPHLPPLIPVMNVGSTSNLAASPEQVILADRLPTTWQEVEDAAGTVTILPPWLIPMVRYDNGPSLDRTVTDAIVCYPPALIGS